MAKCDQGYLCEVCGREVESMLDSGLYLQYVIGWVDPETLHSRPEIHIRCLPNLAQFIDSREFDPPVVVLGEFDRRQLDPHFVSERSALVTRGYERLLELNAQRRQLTVLEYPLPEAIARWRS